MDPSSFFRFASSSGLAIGGEFGGGYFAGYISHTANGIPTHALIVAPAATGASGTGYTLTTNYSVKTSVSSTPAVTSLFDGRANTNEMISIGISQFPAAQFCTGLNIGGFTDWYLPAIRELEIAYFNLKPTTASNLTSEGGNIYAVPSRAGLYTAGNPPQTTVSLFQSGNSQAFNASAGSYHWSSTFNALDTTKAFSMAFSDGFETDSIAVNSPFRVRAFRRIAL